MIASVNEAVSTWHRRKRGLIEHPHQLRVRELETRPDARHEQLEAARAEFSAAGIAMYGEGTDSLSVVLDKELLAPYPPLLRAIPQAKQVFVAMNCPGGDADVFMTIHQALRTVDDLHVTVPRYSASGAALLLCTAPGLRTMGRNAQITLHPLTILMMGGTRLLRRAAKMLDGKVAYWETQLIARTRLTRAVVQRILRGDGDFVFDSKQALSWGLVDEIRDM